jgi:hypothetical protein
MNGSHLDYKSKLCKLLTDLPLIEQNIRELYDCHEMFEEIELYKSSLQFAVGVGDLGKAFYEANLLEELYIFILTNQ